MEDGKIDYGTYRTSQIAEYYGITNKGLEFYEDKGILSPKRQENGKYRVFELQDCYTMYGAKMFRRCGFSVEETLGMVNCHDFNVYRENMLQKKLVIDQEISIQQRLSYHIQLIVNLLGNLTELTHQYSIVERPAMYRLFVRLCSAPHSSTKKESEEFARWNNWVPINRASLHFPAKQLLQGKSRIDTGIGNVILKEDFDLLRFEESQRIVFYPPCKSIYTVISGDPNDLGTAEWVASALGNLREKGLILQDDPISRFIGIFETAKGIRRFDELWLPI